MKSQTKNVDLVLEGGGVKGIALLGAVLVLSEAGYRFPRIAGTSAGAIVAALVAAYQKDGRDLHDLVDVMHRLDYKRFDDGSILQRTLGRVGDGAEVLLHNGAHTGNYLTEWLTPLLADVGVRTFADLRLPDDPGSSLADYQRYRLVVHASDLSRQVLVRLPWDYAEYGKPADTQLVVDAVRASMSVPFYFRPVTVDTPHGQVTWVDGGLLSNFPITVFDRTDDRPERWPTWGIKLSAQPASDAPDHPQHTPAGLALACLQTATNSDANRYQLDTEGVNRRTVYIDTSMTAALDFDITLQTQNLLFESGSIAAGRFLEQLGAAIPPTQPHPDQPTSV
ncbi:patatin-like phospholipase family protein [Nocardia australiensis]|uniref:patatin-like phospholipase family protein n=1 Tax=Nocardia australiensis TaxID=2887191 RepID=UPI001D143694|nr:patatin-like phospholipase family protein [Nocardia australiensis]